MTLRVRIEVYEPFELVQHAREIVAITGQVMQEDSSDDELVVVADSGAQLAKRPIVRILATPRHMGHSFRELQEGGSVTVSATAETGDDQGSITFLGSVFPSK